MHPILQRRIRLLLYLCAWIPALALLCFVARDPRDASWLRALACIGPACLVFAFACLSPWYICRVQPLRLSEVSGLALTWSTAAIGGAAILAGCAWMVSSAAALPSPNLGLLAGLGAIVYLLSAGLHYAVMAAEASREADNRAAEARSLARDAQLHALRMQINPHFLFNSLHSIAALSTMDGPRAREMCIRLSEFLRSSLGLGERENIPLREELALARGYLEVEHVRFGDRLQVRDEIEAGCEECGVPALLLQPLMENAVKHGVAGLVDGGSIRLAVFRAGADVVVKVENAFDPEMQSAARLGMGLAHVRRRLDVRFGERAFFEAGALPAQRDGEKVESLYRVELRFPCESPMASSRRV
jgi:two-component system sensor histidine kinase AlgZ